MTPRTSRMAKALRIIMCVGFVGHFTLVGLLLSPVNPLVGAAGPLATLYHNGATYQNWHLFSPDPGISSTFLSVRCATPDGATDWFDPLARIEPFAGATDRTLDMKRTLQLRRSMPMRAWSEAEKLHARCKDLRDEALTQCILEQRESFLVSAPMGAALRASAAACRAATDDAALAFEIEIIRTLPKRYSERDDPRPFAQAQRITFPEAFDVPPQ
jgi:hypothetical protein